MLGAAGPDDARAAPARRLDETPAAGGAPPPAGGPAALVSRLREVHLAMLDAVLGGDGLTRVAALAADAVGAPVAIVLPRLGATAVVGRAARRPTRCRRTSWTRCAATSATASRTGRPRCPPASPRRCRSRRATRPWAPCCC